MLRPRVPPDDRAGIAADKLGAVAGPGSLTSGKVGKSDATAKFGTPAIPRQHRTRRCIYRLFNKKAPKPIAKSQYPLPDL